MGDPRTWPVRDLPRALDELLQRAGASGGEGSIRPLPAKYTLAQFDRWVAACARSLGYLGSVRRVRGNRLVDALDEPGPYVVVFPSSQHAQAFVVDSDERCHVIRPDGSDESLALADLVQLHEEPPNEMAALFSGLARGEETFRRLWSANAETDFIVVRYELDGTRPLVAQLAAQSFVPRVFGYAVLGIVQMLVALGAAWTLGDAALTGIVDRGRIIAWAMLAASDIPLAYLSAVALGRLTLDFATVTKRRLLEGALALDEGSWRRQSFADVIARLSEAPIVEETNPAEIVGAIPALVQLVAAFVLLGYGPIGSLFVPLLGLFVIGLAALAYLLRRRRDLVATASLGLSADLVEKIIGHRTRAVQANRQRLHETEDASLAEYCELASGEDVLGTLLAHWDRLWLGAAAAALSVAFVCGAATSSLFVGGLGIYFAMRAFGTLSPSLARLMNWLNAWKWIGPIFVAGGAREASRALPRPDETGLDTVVSSLSFSYGRGRPVLVDASLRIRAGEHILVEGPSGGGKSTLSKLLTGELRPNGGSVIVDGVDRYSVSDEDWRGIVASSPQFYENYIFSNTFAFNLDPHSLGNSVSKPAYELCRELGLDELIEKMPSRELQMLGESGWQLSHGERSRIFMARSILQGARVLILDESFGALDPESLLTAMACVRRHARTLLVISHA